MKYRSLEQYLLFRNSDNRFSIEGREETHDREPIRVLERNLISGLASLGIDISIFKSGHRYQITDEVADLFDCYIRLLYPAYIDYPKKERTAIPLECLVELRNCLLMALYSMDMDEAKVTEEVQKFESRTGCPAITSYCKQSEVTAETMAYFRADWDSALTELEWAQFTDELDFLYRTEWLPELKDRALKKLKCFFKDKNKVFPEENPVDFLTAYYNSMPDE